MGGIHAIEVHGKKKVKKCTENAEKTREIGGS